MITPNLGRIVAEVWEETLRESPNPFDTCGIFNVILGLPVLSYRERLDRQPYNIFGNLIPRIVTVRRHLRQLGNIRLDPARLR